MNTEAQVEAARDLARVLRELVRYWRDEFDWRAVDAS